jgi:hypothetical protein
MDETAAFASGPRNLIVIKRIFITLINALRESRNSQRRGEFADARLSVGFAKVANETVSFKINVLIHA